MRYSLRRRLPCLLVVGVLLFQAVWLVALFRAPTTVPRVQGQFEEGKGCDCQRCSSFTPPGSHSPQRDAQLVLQSNSPQPLSDKLSPFLLILVLSSVDGRERRDTVRRTWAKDLSSSTVVRFSVGTLGLTESQFSSLQDEQQQYSDMLFLTNLQESYHNLTRKVLYSFSWANKNIVFSYLLKCDDDSFVLAKNISRELHERYSTESYYWGFFNGRANPKSKGKWHEKNWFLCDYYLPYALGGGYVLSADLVQAIALNAPKLQLYNSEDVSVGVWLSGYQVERRHDTRFNTEFVSRGCLNVYLVSHKQSISDMLSKHELLHTKGKQCEKQFQTRPSYEYNWDVPPSKCCDRQEGVLIP